ncbi:GAF domain-containing sensor histidine kinase [Spirulina major]|uniref:GAF domain-containing sensor histidine kinase n=1 Tax=Spirulina major TaxID=270636 RepID=UPI0009324F13|nr:ATP-binding protein [Spirulina major]
MYTEFFNPDLKNQDSVQIEILLNRISRQILCSLELDNILAVTATEVRQFLDVDRIKLYRFSPNGDGQVIAESIDQNRLPSLLGLNFPADDIPEEARVLFKTARMRSVVNVAEAQIGQGFRQDPETGAEINEDIRFRSLDPCHQDYLTAMGVQSSLVVPIPQGDDLWGLLVAHHSERWAASPAQMQGIQMVVDQLAVAIAQDHLLQRASVQAQQESILNQVARTLHSITTIDLKTALNTTVQALDGCGGRLFINRTMLEAIITHRSDAEIMACPFDQFELIAEGTQPAIPSGQRFTEIEQSSAWYSLFQTCDQPSWAVENLYTVSQFRNLQPSFRATSIRGMVVLPLKRDRYSFGYLTIFRPEIATETLWAGEFNPDQRQMQPRLSFDIWKESKQGQSQPWMEGDLQLAQRLGQEFAAAIHQQELYQHVRRFNSDLEQQVQERTASLQATVAKLRDTHLQLSQAEKMSGLGQLVTGVCHEITNPVNFISGNLKHARQYFEDLINLVTVYQTIAGDRPEIKAQENAVDLKFLSTDFPRLISSMQTGADRIHKVVRALITFANHDQSELKTVDIHEGIESILLILHHRTKAKTDTPGIDVIKHYGELPQVQCYVSQLNQAMMNLINNAIQAIEMRWLMTETPIQGQLTTTTEVVPVDELAGQLPRIRIRIQDNGCGMTDTVRSHIFEPFFTTKTVSQGTGLGLSICQHIVTERHGGKLTCTSTVGEGSEFCIEIPT